MYCFGVESVVSNIGRVIKALAQYADNTGSITAGTFTGIAIIKGLTGTIEGILLKTPHVQKCPN